MLPIVLVLAWLALQSPIAAVALIICVFGIATVQEARTASLYGFDYSGLIWSGGELQLRGVASPARCAQHWPVAIAYFTGRSPDRLPQDIDRHTLDINRNYERDLRELAAATRAGKTSLVLLDNAFLENAPSRTPPTGSAPYPALCHPATTVITICTARR